jgi:hypothetical protein
MKALITSQFFCSYFYHSALTNWEKAKSTKESPEKFYYGITAIVLFQCVLESYINFMIYDRGVDTVRIGTRNLMEVSIRQKWLEFPRIVIGETFHEDEQPFLDFKELVGLRNKLVHLKTNQLNIEIPLPKENMTVGEVRDFISQPNALSGHVLMDILPVAIAGKDITIGMIRSLHNMLKSEPPKFLSGNVEILAMRMIGS